MLYIVLGCGRHPRIDARIIAVSAQGIPVQDDWSSGDIFQCWQMEQEIKDL